MNLQELQTRHKYSLLSIVIYLSCICFCLCIAQADPNPADTANCGINSAVELSILLGNNPDAEARTDVMRLYDSSTTSLLDVRNMCRSFGTSVVGVKANASELLDQPRSFIASLSSPDHFTVVLDGDDKQVRIRDSESASIEIWPRSLFDTRFTGYALVPEDEDVGNTPILSSFEFDKFVTYDGSAGEVAYSFPIANSGSTPLILELTALSCGCTTALFDNGQETITLSPGIATHFNMSYTVDSKGLLQQIAVVKSNVPSKPLIYFTLRSALPLDLSASPKSLFVSEKMGEEVLKFIVVTAPPSTKLESLHSTVSYLNPKIVEQKSDVSKESWKIEVSGVVGPISSASLGEIVIKTSSALLIVPIRGRITKNIAPERFQAGQTRTMKSSGAALLPRAEDDPHAFIGSPLPLFKVGEFAPDFRVVDANGNPWHLSAMRGQKNVLLTFFPKCFTGGCANHLSSLRDHQKEFDATNTQILAVSVDPAQGDKGQLAFAKEWGFVFPLLPDTSRQLGKQFGAVQNDDELAARMSILIDKRGIVRWIDSDVQVTSHGADVLAKIGELGLS